MAGNLKKASTPDFHSIDIARDREVEYWAQRLEVSPQALKRAVLRAGPVLKDVQRHLSRFSFLL
jgi:hypothetical protein